MPDLPYSNRELDEKFNIVLDKLDGFENDTRNSLTRIETQAEGIDRKVAYTNGKVKKIIVVLVLIGGIIIGQTFPTIHDVISLFAGSVSL